MVARCDATAIGPLRVARSSVLVAIPAGEMAVVLRYALRTLQRARDVRWEWEQRQEARRGRREGN